MVTAKPTTISTDLMPDPQVAKKYKVHLRTLYRWDELPDLKFPPPIRINNRKYRDTKKLAEFDQSRVVAPSPAPRKAPRAAGRFARKAEATA